MKRLCELVDVVVNNEACVVFKPKKDTRMDLVSHGCFRGDEEMIRMTKGRTPEITVFYQDGKSFSYHFGEGSTTVISNNFQKQREMIRECAILDFGIVCDLSYATIPYSDEQLISTTLDIQKLADADRVVTLVSGGGMSGNIRVNNQGMELDVHVKNIPGWFEKRGYHVEFESDISKGLPCGKVYGACVPMKDYQISQMPHELSENKLVRYVQEQLGCDVGKAHEFISCLHEASFADDAQNMLAFYEDEIAEAGLCVKPLSDEELAKLGASVDSALLDDTGDKERSAVLKWLKEYKEKSVDGLISDAAQRSGGSGSKSEVGFDKEL